MQSIPAGTEIQTRKNEQRSLRPKDSGKLTSDKEI